MESVFTSPPLQGIKIVNLGLNAPGPIAAARLVKLGADVTKVEPPLGDPMKTVAAHWYAELCAGQTVLSLDLKTDKGRSDLDGLMASVDLVLASFRPAALARLGLGWERLHSRHPRLSFVGIIGYLHPQEEQTGHDLTYQASLGLLSPPQLPPTLYVDLAGAERAVSSSLALLLQFARTGKPGCAWVSLYECACELAAPLHAGLTAPGGALRGGSPYYSMYQASDGWIAVAALEPHFSAKLISELGLPSGDRSQLEQAFRGRSSAAWEEWANERGLPLAAVRV
jgi:crotonobetainyl-CoA:carnitine CoA-transferase CaiB-like acyl-CoA transferase